MKQFLTIPTIEGNGEENNISLDVDNIEEYIVRSAGTVGSVFGFRPVVRGAPPSQINDSDQTPIYQLTYLFKGNRQARQFYTRLNRGEIDRLINSHLSRPSGPVVRNTNVR